jgi:hypothetical protein
MEDFRKISIEGADALVGRAIAEIRARPQEGGTAFQRLTLIFDDGSSLVVDGTFPACSYMILPEDSLSGLEGRRFDGLACRSFKPRGAKAGCWEADHTLTVIADGDEYTFHWTSVGRENFDVSPEPRIHVRAPSHLPTA